ncbi:CGNR zinc finger domain-containing protein [Streptomyces flavidovirens]|uniref:CGNR zinc finger domain-containing protein n=1 Tax=Streptomyces flavidovirens TaxID=67298 RepID=UPI0033A6B9EC
MNDSDFPEFRMGSVLATSFTATLTERCGDRVERIPVPHRLVDWLAVSGLIVESCSDSELRHAQELREAVHLAATAIAAQDPLPSPAVALINSCSEDGRAVPLLGAAGRKEWRLRSGSVRDALSVIAADAISIVSEERQGRLALCASPTCRAAFFDTSRGGTRRWCEMSTCGNREKKSRFLANKRAATSLTK